MARPRAANYDDRRREILTIAASLFARQGYDRTSMSEIAQALGVSKALFYHYYPSKDALLYDIIHDHLTGLVEVVEDADDPGRPPAERLSHVVAAILGAYKDADAMHKIQINNLASLPAGRQAELKALERRLVEVVSGIVAGLAPGLPRAQVTPLTMSLFGVLNWNYMWFREGGPLSRAAYADLVTRLFVEGIAGLQDARPVAKARRV